MTLRRMTLLVVGLTFLGLIAFAAITLEVTLIRHFNEVEKQSVYQNLQRAQTAVEQDLISLEMAGKEIARSEATQAFLQEPTQVFLEKNLADAVFHDLNINLIVLVKPDGSLAATKALNLSSGLGQAIPDGLIVHLKPGDPILGQWDDGASQSGVLSLPDMPLLLTSFPILSGDGRLLGNLLVGRWLDEIEIQRLAASSHISIGIVAIKAVDQPSGLAKALPSLRQPSDYYAEPQDETSITGYSLISDLYNQPGYLLQVQQPRTIYRNGRIVMNYLVAALILAGLTFAVITLVLLERKVLSPMTQLSKEVSQVGTSRDTSLRVSVAGSEELSSLSQGINGMLESLQRMQTEQRQRVSDLDALYEVSRTLLAQTGTAEISSSACRLAVERFGFGAAWIGIVSKDESEVAPQASYGVEKEEVKPVRVAWKQDTHSVHPVEMVVRVGEMVVQPVRSRSNCWQPFEKEFLAAAALPLSKVAGREAVFCLYSSQKDAFLPDRAQLVQSFANLSGMALESAYLFDQVLAGRQRAQSLSRRLVEVQEQERREIALELHDEIGQILTGLKLLLDTSAVLPFETMFGKLRQAQGLVNELITKVREMSLDLRPAMLDDLGLLPALLWLFERYTSQTRVQVNCQHRGVEHQRFSQDLETVAYRVVQEGLTNVARYAGVSQIDVRLWIIDNVLGIQIEDRGAGFNPEKALANGNSRGLAGMRERVSLLRGQLMIDSKPGQGTCLTVELPLKGYLERRSNAR